ncbi:uroporphyrinogen-III synthase [Bacillaceae bacterium IKA-2]|nr:uroporphyrinogen-III synthase [Bacillaceae bacterium IKA-2]
MDLQGKNILVTRAKAQASALSLQIKKYGGNPVEMPLITCRAVVDKTDITKELNLLHTYDWLVFTSKNGIDFFFQEFRNSGKELSLLEKFKIAVVGTKTEDILEGYGLKADLTPPLFVAESLLAALLKRVKKGENVLIARGSLARNVIGNGLRENDIFVTELDVYETVIEMSSKAKLYELIKKSQIDVVTFTSSSTVDNFVRLLEGTDWRDYIDNLIFASIGPITTKEMKKHRLPVHTEPNQYTLQGMLETVMEKLKEEK